MITAPQLLENLQKANQSLQQRVQPSRVAETSDYLRRREREEAIISGQKPARKKQPAQTSDYARRRAQEKKQGVEEGWKSALAGAALAGSMALGSAEPARAADLSAMSTSYLQQVASGQHARPLVSVDDAKQELQQREQGKSQAVPATKPSSAKTGYSQSYLQSVVDGTHSRPMISVEKARELLQQQYGVNENQGVAEDQDTPQQAKVRAALAAGMQAADKFNAGEVARKQSNQQTNIL
mgnify:CR=1 FL=1